NFANRHATASFRFAVAIVRAIALRASRAWVRCRAHRGSSFFIPAYLLSDSTDRSLEDREPADVPNHCNARSRGGEFFRRFRWAIPVCGLIPNPIDQNPWAHWRSPMDMMRQG